MNIKPIRNDDDLRAAFKRLELVYQAQEGTPEADEMEILVTLIEAYEHKHFPTGSADPVEAIKFRSGCTTDCISPMKVFRLPHSPLNHVQGVGKYLHEKCLYPILVAERLLFIL